MTVGGNKRNLSDFEAIVPVIHRYGWGFVKQFIIADGDGTPRMCRCESFLLDDPGTGVQEAFDQDPGLCLRQCLEATEAYALERELTRKIREFQESRDQAALQPYIRALKKKRAIAEDDPDNHGLLD